jgi:hypothetical protein
LSEIDPYSIEGALEMYQNVRRIVGDEEPRESSRHGNSFMTEKDIRDAHVIYMAGMPISKIVDQVWERFGYANPRTCERGIQRGFRKYGLPFHPPGWDKVKHGQIRTMGRNGYQKARRHLKGINRSQPCSRGGCRSYATRGSTQCYMHTNQEKLEGFPGRVPTG